MVSRKEERTTTEGDGEALSTIAERHSFLGSKDSTLKW